MGSGVVWGVEWARQVGYETSGQTLVAQRTKD